MVDDTMEQRPCYVLSPGARREVEHVAGVAIRSRVEYSVTEEGLPFPHPEDGHRRLGGARSVAPPQERRVLLRHTRHARGDALEELVEGLVEHLEHLHPQVVNAHSGHERPVDRPKPPVTESCYRWGDRCWESRCPCYVQQFCRML